MDALAMQAYSHAMDEVTPKALSKNPVARLWSFFTRRRAQNDQRYIDVLSSLDGSKDVSGAHADLTRNRDSAEARRGFLWIP
jgi:hypothetical protein